MDDTVSSPQNDRSTRSSGISERPVEDRATGSGQPGGVGRVVGLYVAPGGGAPMEDREAVQALAGRGLEDDRYLKGTGYWSDHRWDHLTLAAAEDVERVAREIGTELPARTLRRNVVTRGVDPEDLIGRRFRIGSALFEGLRPCDPCAYLEKLTGLEGLKASLSGRGGLRARILESGTLELGDSVVVVGARNGETGYYSDS